MAETVWVYCDDQTSSNEIFLIKRHVWKTEFENLLDQAVIISKDGECPQWASTSVYQTLNKVIDSSIIEHLRKEEYSVCANHLCETQRSQIFLRFFNSAIKSNLECIVDLYLEKGINLDEIDRDSLEYAIHKAVRAQKVSVLKKVIDRTTNVNVLCGTHQETPLHVAANMQYAEGVELLLKHGADCTSLDREGYSALRAVATVGETDFLEMFFNAIGGNINTCDKKGYTALHYAVFEDKTDIVDWLVSRGADLEAGSDTPLMLAALHGKLNIFIKLVNLGASLTRKNDRFGMTVVHMAAQANYAFGMNEIIKIFVERGLSLDVRDGINRTPVEIARGHVLESFLAHGAGIHVKGSSGRSVVGNFKLLPKAKQKRWYFLLAKLGKASVRDMTRQFGVIDGELMKECCFRCAQELRLMKYTKFGTISLYDVMKCSILDPSYVEHPFLKTTLIDKQFLKRFPIYGLNVRDGYLTAKQRNLLLSKKLMRMFSWAVQSVHGQELVLPYEVCRMILVHLNFTQLETLRLALF